MLLILVKAELPEWPAAPFMRMCISCIKSEAPPIILVPQPVAVPT